MNLRGFAEALCDSALLALDLADENKMHNCMDPSSQGPQTGREETKPMSQTSLLHFNLFWFFSGGKYLGHVNN